MKHLRSLFVFALLASILAACGAGGGAGASPDVASSDAASASPAGGSPAATGSPAAASVAAGAPAPASGAIACQVQGPQVEQLTFWTRATEGNPEYTALKQVADNYAAAGGSPIQFQVVPDADFRPRMALAAPAGEGPDLFGLVAHDWIGEFAATGVALEIPQDAIPGRDDLIEQAIPAVTYNGKIYGMPLFVESLALYYNKDKVQTPPTTWDELVSMAGPLTQGDNYGFGFNTVEQYYQGPFFMGFGSYIFKYNNGTFDTNDIGLNNAGGVEAAKFLRDLYHQKKPAMPEVAVDRTNASSVLEGMFDAGQLAMTIGGPWREPAVQQAGINYGVAKLPTLPNGEPMRPFLGIQALGVNANSPNKEAALDFARFAACDDSINALYQGFGRPPVRTTAMELSAVSQNANVRTWLEQAQVGVPMPNIPAMAQVWKPWGDAMDSIVPPNTPDDQIQSLLDNANQQIKDAIARTQ